MKPKKQYTDSNIFLSLEHLLKFELFSSVLNLGSGNQKSKSVLSGRYASKLRGRGLDFEESRPYVIGDDIRNIDWSVTAKTGKTHSKVFTEEKEKPAFIFVDQSASMGFGSKHKTKAVVAGELASIIAHKIKKGGDRIGGMVYTGHDYGLVTPKRDPRNIIYFLQKVVEANQSIYEPVDFDFDQSLSEVIAKVSNIVSHDFTVFIISDFHRYSESVIEYMSQLSLHNDLVLIKVYDELEEQIPNEAMVVTDRTYQVNLNGKNKRIKEELSAGYKSKYLNFKSELEKYNIIVFDVNTSSPIEEQLLEVFSNYHK